MFDNPLIWVVLLVASLIVLALLGMTMVIWRIESKIRREERIRQQVADAQHWAKQRKEKPTVR